MSMSYIQLIQQCTFTIWGGGVTLNFTPPPFTVATSADPPFYPWPDGAGDHEFVSIAPTS